MEYKEYSGKTAEEALTSALVQMGLTSDQVEYEVVEKGSSGFLGVGSKDALIRVRKKESAPAAEEVPFDMSIFAGIEIPDDDDELEEASSAEEAAREFLSEVLPRMGVKATLEVSMDEENRVMEIEVKGKNTGVLIGKRGQTLDALQYLTSLVVNKKSDEYIRLKLDTENYRQRRKETLENLARNIASKVKRTGREVSLEPMNPYERRIIHSALQNDPYVTTYSEGENLYRHVIVAPKEK